MHLIKNLGEKLLHKQLEEKENFDQEEFLNNDFKIICVETYETDEEIISTVQETE